MFKNRSINTKSTKSVKRPRNMFIVMYWKGNDNCGPCVKTFFFLHILVENLRSAFKHGKRC